MSPVHIPPSDSSRNPRYVSHLTPFLAEHVATAQQRAEGKRRKDAERVQQRKQAMEYLVAFSFTQDNVEPTAVNFQDFNYPYFKLTKQVLVELELAQHDDTFTPPIHYFNPEFDYWVKMKVDSTIVIAASGQRLFFKAIDVKSFPSFDRLHRCNASSLQQQPNLRTMLTQERNQVKRKLVETDIRRHIQQRQSCEVIELSSSSEAEDDVSTIVGDLTPRLNPPKSAAPSFSFSPGPIHPPTGKPQRTHQPLRLPSSVGTRDSDCEACLSSGGEIPDDDALPLYSDPVETTSRARVVPGIAIEAIRFPSSFYAVDIHRGFCFKRRGSFTLEMQFQQLFGVPFKSSTYYDHRARWLQAPKGARDRAVAAGYGEDGRYSTFMAAHPPKDADLKAAKRKLRAATGKPK